MEEIGRRALFREVRRGRTLSWSCADQLAIGSVAGVTRLEVDAVKSGGVHAASEHCLVATPDERAQYGWGDVQVVNGLREHTVILGIDVTGVRICVESSDGKWSVRDLFRMEAGAVPSVANCALDDVTLGLAAAYSDTLVLGHVSAPFSSQPVLYSHKPPGQVTALSFRSDAPLGCGGTRDRARVDIAVGLDGTDEQIQLWQLNLSGVGTEEPETLCSLQTGLFGAVSIMRWWHHSDRSVLAFAAGNGIGVVQLSDDPSDGAQTPKRRLTAGPVAAVAEAHERLVTDIAVARQRKLLASSGSDGAVRLWRMDGEMNPPPRSYLSPLPDSANSVHLAFPLPGITCDEKRLVAAGKLRSVSHERPVYGVAWSPHELVLAVLGTLSLSGHAQGGPLHSGADSDRAPSKFQSVISRSDVALYFDRDVLGEHENATGLTIRQLLDSERTTHADTCPRGTWDITQLVQRMWSDDEEGVVNELRSLAGVRDGPNQHRVLQVVHRIVWSLGHRNQSELAHLRDETVRKLRRAFFIAAMRRLIGSAQIHPGRKSVFVPPLSTREALTVRLMLDEVTAVAQAPGPDDGSTGIDEDLEHLYGSKFADLDVRLECRVCGASVKASDDRCSGSAAHGMLAGALKSTAGRHPVTWDALTLLPIHGTPLPRRCKGCGSCTELITAGGHEYRWLPSPSRCYLCALDFTKRGLDLVSAFKLDGVS